MSSSRSSAKKTPTGRPALRNAVVPIVVLGLWTQAEAAAYLGVSVRYLRDSSCARIELPGNGAKKKESVLRYKPEHVIKWVDSWCTDALIMDGQQESV